MSQFEFFMTFYGLLLGLAVAELLLGFANLLRHRARPQLGLLTPLLGILVFLQMLAVFIDAWRNLQGIEISMNGLALPTAIGVVLFGVNVIVVPRDPTEWSHLDEYFHANRRWSIGLLILANLLILGNEIPHLGRADIAPYVAFNIFGFSVLGCALLLRQRLAIAASLAVAILVFLSAYSRFSVFPLLKLLLS